MDLDLTFANGSINGDCNDDVGRFLINGRYDAATRECHWTKSYVGRHDVSYRGFGEGKGIWGAWEIRRWSRGGFHIWPRGDGAGDELEETSEKTQPADAVAQEQPAVGAASPGRFWTAPASGAFAIHDAAARRERPQAKV